MRFESAALFGMTILAAAGLACSAKLHANPAVASSREGAADVVPIREKSLALSDAALRLRFDGEPTHHEFETISVASMDGEASTDYYGPATGKWNGLARGLGIGASLGLVLFLTQDDEEDDVGSNYDDSDDDGAEALATLFVVAVVVAPVTAAIGGIVGVAAADSGTQVRERQQTFVDTVSARGVQEELRQRVESGIAERTNLSVTSLDQVDPSAAIESAIESAGEGLPSPAGTAATLELLVRKVELGGTWGITPPLTLGVTVDANLKGGDGLLLYEQTFTHEGATLERDEWTEGFVAQEIDLALTVLAKRVVDEVSGLSLWDDGAPSIPLIQPAEDVRLPPEGEDLTDEE